MQGLHDLKHFAFRSDAKDQDCCQLISIYSDNWLKIQRLDPEFVASFTDPTSQMTPEFTQYFANQDRGKNPEEDTGTLSILHDTRSQLTQLETIVNEIQKVVGYHRVQIDTKEVDAENETILRGVRMRLITGKKIITLVLKVPVSYPDEPVKFSHGSL